AQPAHAVGGIRDHPLSVRHRGCVEERECGLHGSMLTRRGDIVVLGWRRFRDASASRALLTHLTIADKPSRCGIGISQPCEQNRAVTSTAPAALTRLDGSPVRALVVDDEAALGELIQLALRYEGWQVETATDGASALSKARALAHD